MKSTQSISAFLQVYRCCEVGEYVFITSAVFFLPKPSHGGFEQLFPTGTYTGIGTNVLSLKHVVKSNTKKKTFLDKFLFGLKA